MSARSEAALTHDHSTVLVYDDSFGSHAPTERGWAPNIEHPSYRQYLELRGPVLVFGNGADRARASCATKHEDSGRPIDGAPQGRDAAMRRKPSRRRPRRCDAVPLEPNP